MRWRGRRQSTNVEDRRGRPAGPRPDAFIQGSAAQRVRRFRTGFDAGRTDACDTFAAERL